MEDSALAGLGLGDRPNDTRHIMYVYKCMRGKRNSAVSSDVGGGGKLCRVRPMVTHPAPPQPPYERPSRTGLARSTEARSARTRSLFSLNARSLV